MIIGNPHEERTAIETYEASLAAWATAQEDPASLSMWTSSLNEFTNSYVETG
jgi:hypothetical protein